MPTANADAFEFTYNRDNVYFEDGIELINFIGRNILNLDEQNHLPVSELFVGEFVFWVPRMNVHSYMDCDPRYVAGDNCACKLF